MSPSFHPLYQHVNMLTSRLTLPTVSTTIPKIPTFTSAQVTHNKQQQVWNSTKKSKQVSPVNKNSLISSLKAETLRTARRGAGRSQPTPITPLRKKKSSFTWASQRERWGRKTLIQRLKLFNSKVPAVQRRYRSFKSQFLYENWALTSPRRPGRKVKPNVTS